LTHELWDFIPLPFEPFLPPLPVRIAMPPPHQLRFERWAQVPELIRAAFPAQT